MRQSQLLRFPPNFMERNYTSSYTTYKLMSPLADWLGSNKNQKGTFIPNLAADHMIVSPLSRRPTTPRVVKRFPASGRFIRSDNARYSF
jgi:hypothetical protein